jgi:prepilin-type N-terminal cleavage/methylation domain-containing protein
VLGFRRRLRTGGRSRAVEHGFSLVEICVTVAIMGIALALLVGSMATAESTSDLVTLRSQAESYARKLGELVRSPNVPLQCNTADLEHSYETAITNALANAGGASSTFTFDVTDAAYTNTPTNYDPDSWTHHSCAGAVLPQRAWVEIEVSGGGVSTTVAVVQRNASPA